jgi:hypothetical protein
VTFPLADALCWLLASRWVLTSSNGRSPRRPERFGRGRGCVGFLSDLCHVQASARPVKRSNLRRSDLRLQPPSGRDDPNAIGRCGGEMVDEIEGIIPGFGMSARIYMDVIEADGSHVAKAGPCVRFTGLERFQTLRSRLDGCLTGSRLAKDRAAEALTRVMIPEAPDYPA